MSFPVYPALQPYAYSSANRPQSVMPMNLMPAWSGNSLSTGNIFKDRVNLRAPAKALPPGHCLAAPRLLNSEERQAIQKSGMRWWPKDYGFGGWQNLYAPATSALSNPLKSTVTLTSAILSMYALGGMFLHAANNEGKARWQGLLTKGVSKGIWDGIKLGGWALFPVTLFVWHKRDQYVKNYVDTHAPGATIRQMFQDEHYPKNLWTWGDRYLVGRKAKAG